MSSVRSELPAVCCVMVTANRAAMAQRAVECFRRQTYTPRFMLVYDTGKFTSRSMFSDPAALSPPNDPWGILIAHGADPEGRTIGELRNAASLHACEEFNPDILIHWDDDDYSHPGRIAEQVALLESSGADAVGYRELLFWREDPNGMDALSEAWLYTNHNPAYAVGSSLCYRRAAWERRPFGALPKTKGGTGEDTVWLRGMKSVGVSSLETGEPRMICLIHGGNTQYYGADLLERASNWRRAYERDVYCRGAMEGAHA